MKRRLKIVASCLALLWSYPAAAELQYWVSVGSFQSQENAHKAAQVALDSLGEQFSVVGVSTAGGFYHRVASGPFRSRELADDRLRSARNSGFDGAWLWVDQESVFSQATTASVEYQSLDEISYDEYDLGSIEDYDADLYNEDYEPQFNPDDAELRARRVEVPELVEQAPEGYSLNKLRRGA